MKTSLIFVSALFTYCIFSCATPKDSTNNHNMQLIKATYQPWSEKLPNTSLPENGADLRLFLTHWPQQYQPAYIIFEGYKSFSATIADSSESDIIVQARVIRSSGVLAQTSTKSDLSDRLVYTTAMGDTSFIEIEEWEQATK